METDYMWIRQAQDSDMDAISSLEKECFTDAWSEALISNMFSNSYDKIYVLEEDEKVVGYINTRDIGGDVDLMSLCVSPEYRRKGYAGKLMERILCEPYNQIILEVRQSNEPAIRLYEKYGFEKFARRERYYSSPDEDAIIMIRKKNKRK